MSSLAVPAKTLIAAITIAVPKRDSAEDACSFEMIRARLTVLTAGRATFGSLGPISSGWAAPSDKPLRCRVGGTGLAQTWAAGTSTRTLLIVLPGLWVDTNAAAGCPPFLPAVRKYPNCNGA